MSPIARRWLEKRIEELSAEGEKVKRRGVTDDLDGWDSGELDRGEQLLSLAEEPRGLLP